MNNVTLVGRLTKNPEVRYTSKSQMAVARFSVAVDRPVKKGGEKQADFPNVVVFGKQAENCERFVVKGSLIGIQGRIQTGKYTNKDGATVYTTDVIANNVEFLDWKGREEKQEAPSRQEDIPDGFQAMDDEDIPF